MAKEAELGLFRRINLFLGRQPPAAILVACLLFVAVAGVGDYLTGVEVSSALFYLVPILVGTWYVGTTFGVLLAVLSTASLVIGDAIWGYGSRHPAVVGWNAVAPLGFYVVFVSLLIQLKSSLRREQVLSRTDALTGLYNRRFFGELAELELERARRYGHPFGLAYLDLDNFKSVNDRFGHDTGDELLVLFAELVGQGLRAIDTVGRLGGDEFAVLLPEASPEACAMVMHRVRQEVLATMEEHGWPVSVSVGLVAYLQAPDSVEAMISEADGLMYEVKASGKNDIRVEVVGTEG